MHVLHDGADDVGTILQGVRHGVRWPAGSIYAVSSLLVVVEKRIPPPPFGCFLSIGLPLPLFSLFLSLGSDSDFWKAAGFG